MGWNHFTCDLYCILNELFIEGLLHCYGLLDFTLCGFKYNNMEKFKTAHYNRSLLTHWFFIASESVISVWIEKKMFTNLAPLIFMMWERERRGVNIVWRNIMLILNSKSIWKFKWVEKQFWRKSLWGKCNDDVKIIVLKRQTWAVFLMVFDLKGSNFVEL